MGTGFFLHTACLANVNYRLAAFSMMEHLFLAALKVEARFPAGTMKNRGGGKKKKRCDNRRCNLTFR